MPTPMLNPIPIELDTLPQAAQRAVGSTTAARLLVARGVAPLVPIALVSALAVLRTDEDETVAAAARRTLDDLPNTVLDGAFGSPELPTTVIDALAVHYGRRSDLLFRIAQHARTSHDTIVHLASTGDDTMCELIAINEQRLLAAPKIIEALYLNAACRMSTADRLMELAGRNKLELDLPGYREVVASLANALIPEPGQITPADEMFREALDEGETYEFEDDEDVVEIDEEGVEKVKEKFSKVEKRLEDMSMSEKVRAAMIGSAAHRALLIRSVNRVVAMAAISSPKLQEADAVKFAASRQVLEDVLRFIGNKRDFIRHYSCKYNLVFNPKTPSDVSMKMVQYLRESDVQKVAKGKNLPQSVKTTALQLIRKREEKGKK